MLVCPSSFLLAAKRTMRANYDSWVCEHSFRNLCGGPNFSLPSKMPWPFAKSSDFHRTSESGCVVGIRFETGRSCPAAQIVTSAERSTSAELDEIREGSFCKDLKFCP